MTPGFENIQLYNLFTTILKIEVRVVAAFVFCLFVCVHHCAVFFSFVYLTRLLLRVCSLSSSLFLTLTLSTTQKFAARNNGTRGALDSILRNPPSRPKH